MEYNTRLVMISSGLLGCMAGAVGVYLLLRRKSLIGDTICHATIPGLALSFLIQVVLGGDGKNLLWLLIGSTISGCLGSISVLMLSRWTRLKPDAILGTVLSVFFGIGMVLFSITQNFGGNAAGLENFILGKTASIVARDFQMLLACAAIVLIGLGAFRKELQLLCFDSSFAAASGWPVLGLDLFLLFAVLLVVIVGANIVGVILVVALMVIPSASARFWTYKLYKTVWISSLIGGLAGLSGSLISRLGGALPTGPMIVLSATALFFFSFLFGNKKGLIWRFWDQRRFQYQADCEHVLRAIFEILESQGNAPAPLGQTKTRAVSPSSLIPMRSWGVLRLRKAMDAICQVGWAHRDSEGCIVLTAAGIQASLKAVRRHRLLEYYFSHLADLSPAALDRGADILEHAMDDEMLAKLERELLAPELTDRVPASVHPI